MTRNTSISSAYEYVRNVMNNINILKTNHNSYTSMLLMKYLNIEARICVNYWNLRSSSTMWGQIIIILIMHVWEAICGFQIDKEHDRMSECVCTRNCTHLWAISEHNSTTEYDSLTLNLAICSFWQNNSKEGKSSGYRD